MLLIILEVFKKNFTQDKYIVLCVHVCMHVCARHYKLWIDGVNWTNNRSLIATETTHMVPNLIYPNTQLILWF